MGAQDNLTLIRGLFEAVNSEDMDSVRARLAPGFVRHDLSNVIGVLTGGDATADFLQTLRRGLPDMRLDIEEIIATDDRVVVRLTARGTHRGEFLGAPPTGREVSFAGINIYRIVDQKIAETWQLTDWSGALRQMAVASSTVNP